MKVIIPLAGKGTRLRPHTHTKPKPLLHVAGKAILSHILDDLKKSNLKISEIIFITGHLKEKIEEFVSKNYKFKLRFIEQKTMDGTAGAISLAKTFVDEEVLIIYADTIFETDLGIIKKVQSNKNIDGIFWVKEVEDYQRFGVVVKDQNNFMTKMVEKPKEPISKLANIGVYYIKNYNMMFEGIEHIYKNKITLKGEFFLTDAFQYMIEKGAKLLVTDVKGWYDCGKAETLLETNRTLLKKYHATKSKLKNSLIIGNVFIEEGVIIENSIIGPDVSITKGCEIKDSIIKNSIIDENSKLYKIQLSDSLIGANALVVGNFKKLNIGDSSEIHYDHENNS